MKTAILFFVLLVATVPVHGEGIQYTDPELHYSIKLPEGWRRLPSEALGQAAEAFRLQMGRPLPKYEAWFQRSEKPDGDYPYLLIGRQICRMPTLNELAAGSKIIAQSTVEKANNELKEVGKNFRIADPEIDLRRNVVWIETEQIVTLGDTGKVEGKICLFPGKAGVAQLEFYTTTDDLEHSKADFDFVVDSFMFEPSYDYQSSQGTDSSKPGINFDRVLMFALISGALGPLIYGLLKRLNPDYPLRLQRLRVLFVLLIVLSGIETVIHPPNGPFTLAFDLGCISVGFLGLVFLWSRNRKGSSNPAEETPTDIPPSS